MSPAGPRRRAARQPLLHHRNDAADHDRTADQVAQIFVGNGIAQLAIAADFTAGGVDGVDRERPGVNHQGEPEHDRRGDPDDECNALPVERRAVPPRAQQRRGGEKPRDRKHADGDDGRGEGVADGRSPPEGFDDAALYVGGNPEDQGRQGEGGNDRRHGPATRGRHA